MNAPRHIGPAEEAYEAGQEALSVAYEVEIAQAQSHMLDALANLRRIEEMGASRFGPDGYDFEDVIGYLRDWAGCNESRVWPDYQTQTGAV